MADSATFIWLASHPIAVPIQMRPIPRIPTPDWCRTSRLGLGTVGRENGVKVPFTRKMTGKDVSRAIKQYKIDVEKVNPVGV